MGFDCYIDETKEWVSNWDLDEKPIPISSARDLGNNKMEFLVSVPLKKRNRILDVPKWVKIGSRVKKWICEVDENYTIKITEFSFSPYSWNIINYNAELNNIDDNLMNVNTNISRVMNKKSVVDFEVGDLFKITKEITYQDKSFDRNKIGIISHIRHRGHGRLFCEITCDEQKAPVVLTDIDVKHIPLNSLGNKEKEQFKKILKDIKNN